MIEFEIIDSPDPELIGKNIFYKNQIFIGPKGKDVYIPSSNKLGNVSIDVFPQCLAVTPNRDIDFFLLNGKRSNTTRKVNIGDIIEIDDNKIKITNAEYQVYQLKEDILKDNLKEIIENNPKKLEIIKTLEKKLKEL